MNASSEIFPFFFFVLNSDKFSAKQELIKIKELIKSSKAEHGFLLNRRHVMDSDSEQRHKETLMLMSINVINTQC